MTPYQLYSWGLCVTTSLALGLMLWRARFLLVKPSVIVIIFFHLQIQWAATIKAAYVEAFLTDPLPFAVLAQGFPLIGLAGSLLTARRGARRVWERMATGAGQEPAVSRVAAALLAAIVVVITAWYLVVVPIRTTGLYAILFDPGRAAIAREMSAKLLPGAGIRYAYALLGSTFAPLLASLMVLVLIRAVVRRTLPSAAGAILVILALMVAVGLSGTRISAVRVLVVVLLTYFYARGMPVGPGHVLLYVAGAIGALAIPSVLSTLRTGNELTIANVVRWLLFRGGTLQRIFFAPMQTAVWYVDYAQTYGFFGVRGLEKLARLLGEPAVDVPNVIGLYYLGDKIASVSAGTAHVFAYYSYFGPVSLVFSLVALWSLDLAVVVYGSLSDRALVPCVACVSIASVSLVASDYTTVLITHGFAVLLAVTWLLDRLDRRLSERERSMVVAGPAAGRAGEA